MASEHGQRSGEWYLVPLKKAFDTADDDILIPKLRLVFMEFMHGVFSCFNNQLLYGFRVWMA